MSMRVTITRDLRGPAIIKRATTTDDADRLQAEVARLRRARHPGLVTLLSSRAIGDAVEMRTRYAGDTLDRWCGTAPAIAGLCAAVAATLADLHEMGIVHGRLDPSHVLVGGDGRPRLCGLSQLDDPSPADDVEALGRLMADLAERAADHQRRPLAWPRSGVSGRRALAPVIARALDPRPSRRPSARTLTRFILAAVPGAELVEPGPAPALPRDEADDATDAHASPAPPPGPDDEPEDHPVADLDGEPDPAGGPRATGRDDRPGPVTGSLHLTGDRDRGRDDRPAADRDDRAGPGTGAHIDDLVRSRAASHIDDGPATTSELGGHRSAPPSADLPAAAAQGDETPSLPRTDHEADAPTMPAHPVDDADEQHEDTEARAMTVPGGTVGRRSPTPSGPRRTGAARAGSTCAVGLAVVVGGLLATRSQAADGHDPAVSPGEASAAAATPAPRCPAAAAPAADVDADGCPDPLRIEGNIVEGHGARWSVGEAGDVVAVGDWDCDGSASPAVLRPATGEVFVFTGWAADGDPVSAVAARQVEGATAIRAETRGGCDDLIADRSNGGSVTVEAG